MQVYHPINNYTESLRFTYCFIHNLTLIISFIIMIFRNDSYCQVSASDQNQSVTGNWQLYPYTYPEKPEISSPFTFEDGNETVVVMTKDDKYGIIPVTVENGKPLLYSRKIEHLIGKDQQLEVAAGDFPVLAATGLHDEASLLLKEWITGLPVDIITTIARPLAYSHVGFIAEDENIISVLNSSLWMMNRPSGLRHLFSCFRLYNSRTFSLRFRRWGSSNFHYRCFPVQSCW